MFHQLKRVVRFALGELGYEVVRSRPELGPSERSEYPPDFDERMVALCRSVRPFTMTSPERIHALRESVRHVTKHQIPGAIVECGVWRGGSMMTAAATLLESDDRSRTLYLFDTFTGMPEPSDIDKDNRGELAATRLEREDRTTGAVWANSPIDEVRRNMRATGYPEDRVVLVAGRVEQTIPDAAPEQIALLRLDTDWYESTRHELVHLYPRLSVGGVLIIDDYGHWEGARRAVDEFIEEHRLKLLLSRIDYTGRLAVKQEP